ncbi:c-type cytochrome biogenesis protein CcmI [Acetobacteraceae bacterium H6797]|nr:c-type cytochrome biogenesis protein CcmI [Acetobacteraceae bacterium H6797]
MIWLLFLALAALALAPLAWSLLRPAAPRGRHEADLALFAAQRAELERERESGRLDEPGYQAALLELQRRLVASPADEAPATGGHAKAALLAGLFLIPAAGLGLYIYDGQPGIPAAPFEERQQVAQRDAALIEALRARIGQLPPQSDSARQGWLLLGQAERARGNYDAAADAWSRALTMRFDANLAGDLAQLEMERGNDTAAAQWLTRAMAAQPDDPRLRFLAGLAEARAGRVENARNVWRSLLADAPPDAPWRAIVERQLRELQ